MTTIITIKMYNTNYVTYDYFYTIYNYYVYFYNNNRQKGHGRKTENLFCTY